MPTVRGSFLTCHLPAIDRAVLRAFARGVIVLALPVPAGAQGAAQRGAVAGIVVEARSGLPVSGAQVGVPGTGIGTSTSADGRFRLPAGFDGEDRTGRCYYVLSAPAAPLDDAATSA